MTHTIEVTQADYDAAQAFFRDERTGLAVKFQLGADPQVLLEAFARHRTETLSSAAGEPVAWMYAPIKPLPNHDPYFVQQNRANMDPRFWTETPLYPAPSSQRALVEALEWYGEQARLARLIHSEGDAGRHALAADGGKRASDVLAALSLTKAQEKPA